MFTNYIYMIDFLLFRTSVDMGISQGMFARSEFTDIAATTFFSLSLQTCLMAFKRALLSPSTPNSSKHVFTGYPLYLGHSQAQTQGPPAS